MKVRWKEKSAEIVAAKIKKRIDDDIAEKEKKKKKNEYNDQRYVEISRNKTAGKDMCEKVVVVKGKKTEKVAVEIL